MIFQSGHPFYGLTQEYRLHLFRQIHEIVFYGKGGYDFDTVYNLPIWLRNYIYHCISEHYEKEAEAIKGTSTVPKNIPNIPKEEFPGMSIKRPVHS